MKALIVVDMQNDFIDGSLGTKEAVAILDNVVKRIEECKNELIIFTQDTHGEDYLDTPEGKKLQVVHCLEGTTGWQIHDRIQQACKENENTIVFTKPVFGSTKLVNFLEGRKNEIKEVEILGVCTDICVVSNAIMIKNTIPDMKISVNAKCCAGVTPKSHQEALNVMEMCQIDIV